MSFKQCCSLCCSASSEYKLLQNEEGESNEIYEITVKYFDPMVSDILQILTTIKVMK